MKGLDEVLQCVYKITNTVNNMAYIGTTGCLQYRWYGHRTASRKGKNPLYQEMRVYGLDKFIIEAVEENIRSGIANDREAYWIDYFCTASPHGYNVDAGSLKRQRIRDAKQAAAEGKH